MKALEITFLGKLEKGNINANESIGNLTTIKKTVDFDGQHRVYISPRSLKFAVKEVLKSKGEPISSLQKIANALTTEGNPKKNVDDDLFGYFLATNPPRTRTAPIRSLGAISIHPINIEIDRGGRYDPNKQFDPVPFETEIASAIIRSSWLVELDRVGTFEEKELDDNTKKDIQKDKDKKYSLTDDIKKDRTKKFLKALLLESLLARATNNLVDMTPMVIVFALTNVKRLVIGRNLSVSKNKVEMEKIKERINLYGRYIEKIWILNSLDVCIDIKEEDKKVKIKEEENKEKEITITIDKIEKLQEKIEEVVNECYKQ